MKNFVIRDQRRPLRTTRREQGFVQGVLLFALAVLVAIIAAFAFANNGNQGSAERENAKVTATVLMKQASDVQDAVGRYIADAQGLKYLCVTSGVSTTQQVGGTTLGTAGDENSAAACASVEVDLWSSSLGYITPPKAPSAAFASSAEAGKRAWGYAAFSANGRTGLDTATAPGYFSFMEAVNLDRKVCQAINRLIGLSFPYETPTNMETEMCYQTGTGDTAKYTYRKVIATRK